MRPSAVTAAASVSTAPAPPTARVPRWTTCQSLANPSTLEYSHIGDTTIRFRSVTLRIVSGENNSEGISYDVLMLCATTTMAARIERAEAGVAREFAERARARGRDVLIEAIGGTTAVYGGPGEPFNKVAGLGFAPGVDETSLARLEAAYDARGAEIRVEQASLADPA